MKMNSPSHPMYFIVRSLAPIHNCSAMKNNTAALCCNVYNVLITHASDDSSDLTFWVFMDSFIVSELELTYHFVDQVS